MRLLAGLAVAMLWAGSGAAAQTMVPPVPSKPQEQIDPDRLAAARALMKEMEVVELTVATARVTSEATLQIALESLRRQGLSVAPELLEQMKKLVKNETEALIQEIASTVIEDSARIYARHFTASELLQMKDVQAQPVMRKLRTITPQLTAELTAVNADRAAQRQAETMRKMRDLVKNWFEQTPTEAPGTVPTS